MRITLAILILFSSALAHASDSRLDEAGYKRASELSHIVAEASESRDIPMWVLYGIAYNESNLKSVRGDGGRAWGIGQIHCGSKGFSWLPFLKQHTDVSSCSDLMQVQHSIESISAILSYLRAKDMARNRFSWEGVLTSYHRGEGWRKRKEGYSSGYVRRVEEFGKAIADRMSFSTN